MSDHVAPEIFDEWLGKLEQRHLADLRVPEVTRALRALSSAYVERRHKVGAGAALDGAGKRAAFALFYAPLHFLTTFHVVRSLGPATAPTSILDLGCGTGAAGAAFAMAVARPTPSVTAIDRLPWAVDEARWTYRQFHLDASVRIGDLKRLPAIPPTSAVLAAYTLNELSAEARQRLEQALLQAGRAGTEILVLEPIARAIAPWWDDLATRVVAAGGRADQWRFRVDLPPLLRLFDRAAGLHHEELTVRSLTMNFGRSASPLDP